MEIQNCSNHSILISNLAPLATILIFLKYMTFQTKHKCRIILKLVGKHQDHMGIETFLTRLFHILATETYNVLHCHLVSGR